MARTDDDADVNVDVDVAEAEDGDEDQDKDDEWQPPQTTTRARTDTKFRLQPRTGEAAEPRVATRATSHSCIALHHNATGTGRNYC